MSTYYLNLSRHVRSQLKSSNLNYLEKAIAYQFKDKALLKSALTHRSLGSNNNERLEFLGDSILSLVITQALFERYSNSSEGELSRLRSFLVKGETLADISRELNLGDYVQLGQGELKSGGFRRGSILADCFEAMIAAIFLDAGFDQARKTVLGIYQSRLINKDIFNHLKDPKTKLQEYLQGKKHSLPSYEVISITGEQHNQKFEVYCRVKALALETIGIGSTRRKAEKQAAEKMLEELQN